eukprot:TRINITY_DN2614_c0_g1_i4.p1 TRINITY_DN2614_c0_g1~~TRINITY_DN2614_c0_g1_i4.p1  ORF type:complete len:230 (+),score=49.97 TRINITY_DN2614_c0_g1_i4:71-691(+)
MEDPSNTIQVLVKYGTKLLKLNVDPTITLMEFRQQLHKETDVLPVMQKLMFRTLLKDEDKTLQELKISNNSRLMLTGSKFDDVEAITKVAVKAESNAPKDTPEEKEVDPNDEIEHKKVLEILPSDAIPAIPNKHESIPSLGIKGLKNKMNVTVRLSFKSDIGQVIISSSSSTQKVKNSFPSNYLTNGEGHHQIDPSPEFLFGGSKI